MSQITRHVVARLPEHELAIERLARNSESFRTMCEEYAEGADALERWQGSTDHAAEVAELRELLTELEDEILQRLQEEATLRPGRRLGAGQR